MINADPPLIVAFEILGYQNGARFCFGQLRSVFAVTEKTQLLAASFRQGRDGHDLAAPVTSILAANEINDFSERNSWHGSESIGLPGRIKAAKSYRPKSPGTSPRMQKA